MTTECLTTKRKQWSKPEMSELSMDISDFYGSVGATIDTGDGSTS